MTEHQERDKRIAIQIRARLVKRLYINGYAATVADRRRLDSDIATGRTHIKSQQIEPGAINVNTD